MDIQELANLTAGDVDVDNFERFFTKLKEMKGEASLVYWYFLPFKLFQFNLRVSFFSL